ncbi:cell wall metabolism sensor histidine kinase WalK [Vagococcus intermedius]|uniref:histidine kinase n=1 Tax=Vagococcus intermedius TaxID=2991418 RepID=A0AAF0CV58_9ENTE|nr:cell wall metabolism sensor histidine kinase WalK [Vagococcus intermedius]WEG73563.1 cell wall metabolism sensor histidine kinase WalK [Vagococcus intermedius]WEG75645.1 cell wall metabolism sensor histidine kinase WalK [Vagococcus intermedius]
MRKKISFFQSVHFKIAMVFVLLLLISVEIIGAIFIRELEKNTLTTFKETMNVQVESLASNLSTELIAGDEEGDAVLKRTVNEFSKRDVYEVRVVDDKGIVRASSDANNQNIIGKKNDIAALNDFTEKRQEQKDSETKQRVYINVQQIRSPAGDAVIGGVYVKSDIESKYGEINNTTLLFFSASVIAMTISLAVALLVARTITKPIGEMQHQARRIAQGDYSGELEVHGQDELGQLAQTFNELSERVEEAQETLEAERHRLDSVLSHMTDGVVATDRRGKVIIINEKALLLLEKKHETSVGRSILDLLDIEEDYTLRELLEGKNEQLLTINHEGEEDETIIKADFAMIRRESGFISGLVCVLHDVTEQEKNERERREFVSNVSHELRTPLTSMRSYLEALSDGAWEDPEIAPRFINVSLVETDRMIRMINDLLNLSRMDSQRSPLQKELLNLNELVNFVLDRFEMMINKENQNYTIKREFTRRVIWVEADQDRLMQVLDNIMNNALKYSPDGGEITCTLLETHNNVILSVSDQGMGIPKKDVKRIFDRFFRVDKARSRAMGGSGLGLAISKEVINDHGGTIWAESEEGKGSTFYLSLPYEPIEEDDWE